MKRKEFWQKRWIFLNIWLVETNVRKVYNTISI